MSGAAVLRSALGIVLALGVAAGALLPVVSAQAAGEKGETDAAAAGSPRELLEQARKVYSQDGPRAALPLFEQAERGFREAGDELDASIVVGLIGNCYKRFGEYDQALAHLERAFRTKRRLKARLEEGRTLNHLGLLHWERGDYAASVASFTAAGKVAQDLADRALEAAVLNNLALVKDEHGESRAAAADYERALRILRETGDRANQAATLANLGGVHYALGDFRAASLRYRESVALSRELGLKPAAAEALGNLALCHLSLDEVPVALPLLDEALALAREAGLKKEEADWLRYRGSALVRTGELGEALASYASALQVYERAGMKRELAEALVDLARLRLLVGETEQSRKELERAHEVATSIGHARGALLALVTRGDLERRTGNAAGALERWSQALRTAQAMGDKGQEAELLGHLAELAVADRRLGDAEKHYQASLAIARAQGMRSLEAQALGGTADVRREQGALEPALALYDQALAIAAEIQSPEIVWPLQHDRGRALERLGRREPAVAAYRASIDAIERIRGRLGDAALRSGYMEERCQVYADLARLLIAMGRLGEAFGFVERHRARAYLDVVGGERGLAAPSPGGGRRAEERELRRKIERLSAVLAGERGKAAGERREAAFTTYSRELAEAERSYTLLLGELRVSDPLYASRLSVEPLDVAEVQGRLDPDTALIEYFLTDDALHLFVLTATDLAHAERPLARTELGARIKLLRDRLGLAGAEDWQGPAEALFERLVAPAEATGLLTRARRLYLVPQGVLHYLPFAALARPAGGRDRFLVERYELVHLPSASSILVSGSRRTEEARGSALAFAPESPGLGHVAEEALAVKALFGRDAHALVGPAASERLCRKRCGEYGLLHFATHSRLDPANPLFSYVELEGGQGEDGRLHVFEVAELALHADLVTLSACNTAVGLGYFRDLPAGDDLVSLTRAFLEAGAASVVASLWEVDDRATTAFMRRFYAYLKTADRATALARAQRELIASRSPRDRTGAWASFVLIGAAR